MNDVLLTGDGATGITLGGLQRLAAADRQLSVRLGRVRPKARPQALRFATYLKGAPPTPPTKIDYYTKALAVVQRMYLNDQLGCCVISDRYHSEGVVTANDSDSGGTVLAQDSEVLASYRIWNPGRQDNGCVITDVLDYQREHGLIMAGKPRKISGYVAIDWTNKLEVQVAILLFGTVTLGINLPSDWTRSAVWDVTNSGIVGGHDVVAIGYDEQGVQISSWGRIYTITWAAFTSRRWLDEAYAVLHPDWTGNDKLAPNGIDVATLADDLAKIGGGTIPPIDPPAPPAPPVPPDPPARQVARVASQTVPISVHVPLLGACTGVATIPGQDAPIVSMPAAERTGILDYLWLVRDVVPLVAHVIANDWPAVIADLEKLASDWRSRRLSTAPASAEFPFGQLFADVEKLISDIEGFLPDIRRIEQVVIADVRAIAADLGIAWPGA